MPKNENEFRGFRCLRQASSETSGAGICRDWNMLAAAEIVCPRFEGQEYAANEYAEKRKGGRSPEYSGTPPPFLSG